MMVVKSILILFLFVSWPFISFSAHNINKSLFVGELLNFYVVVMLVSALCYLSLYKISVKNSNSLNVTIFLTIMLFMFSAFNVPLKEMHIIYTLLLWSLFCFVGTIIVWKLSYNNFPVKLYIILLLALYTVPIATIIQYELYNKQNINPPGNNMLPDISGNKPNVYFFIFDAFARTDVLKNKFSHDNDKFISNLEDNGFHVVENSFSNYPVTLFSISSTLSMQYVISKGETINKETRYDQNIRGEGGVPRYFKSQGYKYVHAHTKAWGGSRCLTSSGLIDLCIPEQSATVQGMVLKGESLEKILNLTPLVYFIKFLYRLNPDIDKYFVQLGLLQNLNIQHVEQISNKIDWLQKNKPFFLFGHILAPHKPHTYGENCERVPEFYSKPENSYKTYATQVRCLEFDILELVKTIVRVDKNNPIIIFQGDHGAAMKNQFEQKLIDWKHEDILERYGILNAIKLPIKCKDLLYSNMTPVNTFRVVISCLSNKSVPLLEDISLFATYPNSPDYGLPKVLIRDGTIQR